jgi:hypothetical protein
MLDMFGMSGGPDVLSYVRTIGIGRIYGSIKGKFKLCFRLTSYNENQKSQTGPGKPSRSDSNKEEMP